METLDKTYAAGLHWLITAGLCVELALAYHGGGVAGGACVRHDEDDVIGWICRLRDMVVDVESKCIRSA